jgi:pyrroline-5-carboxylate reductase
MTTPILLLGAGRMGGALVEGWGRAGAFRPADLIIRDPPPGPHASKAAEGGAILNPPDARLAEAKTVLMAVKPQVWQNVAAEVAPLLAPDAIVVSIAAGVMTPDLAKGFGGRRIARVMPTTAVAIGQGVGSIFSADPEARARAHALFDPVATTADLEDESLIDAATAVSGSAPAYVYAFVEALEAAGARAGLPPETAKRLARATVAGAGALMQETGVEPSELRRQVTSPGGTTAAALKVLMAEDNGFGPLMERAVEACIARAKELAG